MWWFVQVALADALFSDRWLSCENPGTPAETGMSKGNNPRAADVTWGEWESQHQIRIGLAMTPAERLRWLEDTVEELRPWLGLARKGRETHLPSADEPET